MPDSLLAVEELYSTLDQPPNEEQSSAIEALDGPLRIIAGPGSGKTHVLVLRTLNLVACAGLDPSKIVVVTFTEKAAAELGARLRQYSNRLPGPPLHLAELNVGTIHWFCGTVLRRYHPGMRRFEPLDELGQQLFIYDRLPRICDDLVIDHKYLGKWASKSRAVSGLIEWFAKVTEETIEADTLEACGDDFLEQLGVAFSRYRAYLHSEGYLDFGFILRELHDLLVNDEQALAAAQNQFSHFMVDEYQDTNYVQEAILLKLASPIYNLAVVGDDDQSLYRFRGAEVRNILQLPARLADLGAECSEVALTVNYRSHPKVIATYLDFMEDGDWNQNEDSFRTAHNVVPDPSADFQDYPAVVHTDGSANKIAELVKSLITSGAVTDANQIAILFHSVAGEGQAVIESLRAKNILCYAPRARQYLEHTEVRLTIGVLWELARFSPDEEPDEGPVAEVVLWARDCANALRGVSAAAPLVDWLRGRRAKYEALVAGEDMDASLLDLLYQAFRYPPFETLLEDPVAARNIGYLTVLLRVFQQQFRFEVLHAGNRNILPWRLWSSFFFLLKSRGVDDVETDDAVPSGYVQVMTIHQSKGLEFPVVIVGSLDRTPRSRKEIDEKLGPYYPRPQFEPSGRITEFDLRREFYVAFSRAKHLLVTYAPGVPHRFFGGLVTRSPRLTPKRRQSIVDGVKRDSSTGEASKPLLSLTSHINVYRRCARQYRFFRDLEFVPSFAAQVFFGTVVHQTIEDIHRHVLDGRPDVLTDAIIDGYFQRNSELLRKRGIHPLAPAQRQEARAHVQRYYDANSSTLDRVIDTEVEVTLEKDAYLLNGRIDLIKGFDGEIEMVDFKAQKRIDEGEEFEQYRDQLALYESLLEDRYGTIPKRAVLYFTGEDDADQARVTVDLSRADVDDVIARFDDTAQQILTKQFALRSFPSRDTCRACDFRHYCRRTDEDS